MAVIALISPPGEQFLWVDGLTLLADFEVEFDGISPRATFCSNFLPGTNRLTLDDQQLVVVTIGAEVDLVVFDNQQFTEANNPGTCIDHFAGRYSNDGIPAVATDINALVNG